METISVLVVDDEPGIALLCNRILSRGGYEVTSETDPRIAIEHLQHKRVDLLVVDIRMPEVDGFDVISRAQMVQPDVAVLVMTGFGTVETAIRALRQGVDGLLLKPFNKSEELLQAVRQALNDNQRKRDTARVSALRPLFSVSETLFAETDRDRLLDLIVSAICEHLHCSNVAYYEVEKGVVSTIAQRGKVLDVEGNRFAAGLVSRVDADGDPILMNATGGCSGASVLAWAGRGDPDPRGALQSPQRAVRRPGCQRRGPSVPRFRHRDVLRARASGRHCDGKRPAVC
jgi:CheY-like chemotaxis protein